MRLIRCNYCGMELDIKHPTWVMGQLHYYEQATKLTRTYDIDVCADCEHLFSKEIERWRSHIDQEQTRA